MYIFIIINSNNELPIRIHLYLIVGDSGMTIEMDKIIEVNIVPDIEIGRLKIYVDDDLIFSVHFFDV